MVRPLRERPVDLFFVVVFSCFICTCILFDALNALDVSISDTSSNALNCGACGRSCQAAQACVRGACVVLCPDIFGWLLTVFILFYAGAMMLRLDALSILFTGRTFLQSRSALGNSIDRLNRGR